MIKDALFKSVYDGIESTVSCKVDTELRKAFDIQFTDEDRETIPEKEYVIFDGKEILCGEAETDTEDWNEETDYYYVMSEKLDEADV